MIKKKGAIFDMDGTLLDSMGLWEEIDERFLKKRGIPETEIDYVNLDRIDKHTNQPVYETTEKNKKQDEKSAGEA